ncbi:MAG: bifunctional riboflavin kinase/FAD synthetase [Polyangiaceae bacterium]|nr:bifunctional riboflavin kinase/FAD synthetase [Polyangiaceae bacterium]
MQAPLVCGARSVASKAAGTLVLIGNFDGVHKGHQKVVRAACLEASKRGLNPIALTFDPHPASVLAGRTVPLLTTVARRARLMVALCPELRVVVEPFTREFAAELPEQFVRELLIGALEARVVMVGKNFHFGRDRAGNIEVLGALGRDLGFEAIAAPLAGDEEGPYSSTRARQALAAGDLPDFFRVVGRHHAVCGRIVPGDGRGRTLGFPTANLDQIPEALPAHGVYAGSAKLVDELGTEAYLGAAAVNVGVRPTFDGQRPGVEVHVVGFGGDLYGQSLCVEFWARLREERRFAGRAELVRQIELDIEQTIDLARRRS